MKTAVTVAASWLVTLGVPILLVLGSVRVVMTPQYLEFEYRRPDMSVDFYGFTLEDRLRWGPVGIEYLLTDADISILSELRFADGSALFTERELGHMVDVKIVTRAAFNVLAVYGLVIAMSAALLLWRKRTGTLRAAVVRGAILTLGAIVTIVIGAIVAWDTFFALFHRAFFADGTWIFYTSDTLIRLYPEKFWFDAALTIGVMVIAGALAICAAAQWHYRRSLRIPPPAKPV